MTDHSTPFPDVEESNAHSLVTDDRRYNPDRIVKHERYVLMIWTDRKKSIPWERIQEVNEPL